MLEERKLQKAKISLMRNPKFALWSGILMVGKTSVVDNIPTASTNGRNEKYGREFVKELSDKELCFVVLHESLHKAFRHLTTWKKLHDENRQLANAACDYVINLMLLDIDPNGDTIIMPKIKDGPMKGHPMGLIDKRFKGMNAKQVFDILKQEQKEQEGEGGDGTPEDGGTPVDGSGQVPGKGDGKGDPNEGAGLDDHDWDGAAEMTEEERKQLEREVDQAIRQGIMAEKKVGKGAGGMSRELQDLMEPKIDWREVLREFVKSTCSAKDTSSWRRVNRRFLSGDVYMPSLIGEKVGHVVIAIDTSGSIGDRELAEFLSEVKGVAEEVNPDKVDLIYWDSAVAAHEEYEGDGDVSNIVSSTRPKGGGGTSPSCISTFLEYKKIVPECIIILTDGHVGSDWGTGWTAPVLWCIVGGNDVVAPNGKTVHVKD
jgi:predicted metal-dependent peptidase